MWIFKFSPSASTSCNKWSTQLAKSKLYPWPLRTHMTILFIIIYNNFFSLSLSNTSHFRTRGCTCNILWGRQLNNKCARWWTMPCWQQGAWSLSHANLAGLTCHRTIRYTRVGPATRRQQQAPPKLNIIITWTDTVLHHTYISAFHLRAVINLGAKGLVSRIFFFFFFLISVIPLTYLACKERLAALVPSVALQCIC
jgi:hypothetical protein